MVELIVRIAEDFYGNDYPEDEVDSDDEYDNCAYDFRRQGSDNEEYGDDEIDWSVEGAAI